MNNAIKEILDFKEDADYKRLSYGEIKILSDTITNLQEENERLKDYLKIMEKGKDNNLNRFLDYKSRNEKANWWLKEMLKQAKSDETKAIINGTLDLLLQGSDKNE